MIVIMAENNALIVRLYQLIKDFTCKEFCNIFSNLENIVRRKGPKFNTQDASIFIEVKERIVFFNDGVTEVFVSLRTDY